MCNKVCSSKHILSSRFSEHQQSFDSPYVLFGAGNNILVKKLSDFLFRTSAQDLLIYQSRVLEIIKSCPNPFALIYEDKEKIACLVDLSRSWPIFYCREGNSFFVSDDGRRLTRHIEANQVDPAALSEFCFSGFVHGNKTLVERVFQLESGNMLVFNKEKAKINVVEYFNFYPNQLEKDSSYKKLLVGLNEVLDSVFDRIVERLGERAAVIPLSGGLDSKLILTNLIMRGYKNISTFSYGSKSSYEVLRAQELAAKLGVTWYHIPFSRNSYYSRFRGSHRKKYWEFADSLTSVPIMNDYFGLDFLFREGVLADDAVVINGQSGDFISGGHIPRQFVYGNPSKDKLIDAVLTKHLALWKTDVPNKIKKHGININCSGLIDLDLQEPQSVAQLCAEYEMWEWKERQSKLVVNGQRSYEFFGLGWELPFWDPELILFFEKIPYQYRFDQSLFRDCLKSNNYLGLFESPVSENRRWPGISKHLRFGTQVLEEAFRLKDMELSKYVSYIGHYSDQYAQYGFLEFMRVVGKANVPPQARGVLALRVQRWIDENLTIRDGRSCLINH